MIKWDGTEKSTKQVIYMLGDKVGDVLTVDMIK